MKIRSKWIVTITIFKEKVTNHTKLSVIVDPVPLPSFHLNILWARRKIVV